MKEPTLQLSGASSPLANEFKQPFSSPANSTFFTPLTYAVLVDSVQGPFSHVRVSVPRLRGVPAFEDNAVGPCVPTYSVDVPSGWNFLNELMYVQMSPTEKRPMGPGVKRYWASMSQPSVRVLLTFT